METIKEIFQSIYDSYRERIKSPLIGSFIFSFLAFNWKAVTILLYSEWPVHCRIEWIEETHSKWYNYVIPLGFALFYILILPYFNLGFDKILKYYSDSKLEKKNTAKLAQFDQMEKEAKGERKVADAKAGTSEISNLKERNDSLLKELSTAQNQNQEDLKRHNSTIDQYVSRENDYKDQIRIYDIKDRLNSEIENFATIDEVRKIIEIHDSMIDSEKKMFTTAVANLRSGRPSKNIVNFSTFEILGLIIADNERGFVVNKVTHLGGLLFSYIKNGYDLS